MGIERRGPPSDLMLLLKRVGNLRAFVETGTFKGSTAAWAAGHFDRVVTIEASPELYAAAAARHKLANVRFVQGSSRTVLGPVLRELNEPCLLWLDAHWSGGKTSGAGDQCPLLDELQAVNESGLDHAVLIDDARLFLSPPPLPNRMEQWPGIFEIGALLRAGQARYTVVFEDVIVSVPQACRNAVATHCQEVNTATWQRRAHSKGGRMARILLLARNMLRV